MAKDVFKGQFLINNKKITKISQFVKKRERGRGRNKRRKDNFQNGKFQIYTYVSETNAKWQERKKDKKKIVRKVKCLSN